MLFRVTLSLMLLLAVALGATATVLQIRLHGYTTPPTAPASMLSESMQGVTLERYDMKGNRIQTLQMKNWHQFNRETLIHMEQPILTVAHEDGSEWLIQSIRAVGQQSKTKGQFEQLTLINKVNLVQKKAGKNQLELNTEQLDFDPQHKQASTTKPVTVQNDNMTMLATGLQAGLAEKKITFLGTVHSTYAQ